MTFESEIFTVRDGVHAAISDVGDTTTVWDDGDDVVARPVPGHEGYEYVLWGASDDVPHQLIHLIGSDEVTSQNKFFNVLTCYGGGLRFVDENDKPTRNKDLKLWAQRQFLPAYFLNQCTDMKYFFFTVCVFILSRDGKMINRIRHKDACCCRLEKADAQGRIRHIFYGDWQNNPKTVERIPLLDPYDPVGDLMQRMGREPLADGKIHPPVKNKKFAMIMRFPTAGQRYYPMPYYTAIFRGGSYDEKRLISAGKRAKLKNHASVKYQVEVARDYWQRIITEENILDPVKQKERIIEEKRKIKDFVSGVENSGKVWITGYYINPDGKEVRDIRVINIEGAKEGGDWSDEVNVASNTICYGDNVHPNLVGAVPGKSQSNNSGSDKRELFTIKQALEVATHDILLMPLHVVCQYNGWDAVPTVPMVQLTTLDEHRDSKLVNPSKTE